MKSALPWCCFCTRKCNFVSHLRFLQVADQPGIKRFEATDYLPSGEDCAQYLQACMDEAPEDAALFAKAIGDIARALGMMQLARDTGITREGLYKALGEQGNPSFATVIKVMHALGLQFNMGARSVQDRVPN